MYLFKKPWLIALWFVGLFCSIAMLLMHYGVYIIPLWSLPIAIAIYIAFWVFYAKEYKKNKLRSNLGELDKAYNKIYNMDEAKKNDFAITDEARYYFEMVEEKKEALKPDELSKYKTVLFGTEDPYIVTEEGRIIVKACPGNVKKKDD